MGILSILLCNLCFYFLKPTISEAECEKNHHESQLNVTYPIGSSNTHNIIFFPGLTISSLPLSLHHTPPSRSALATSEEAYPTHASPL